MTRLPRPRTARAFKAWAWLLAAVLLAKVWMPLLATAAADAQGLPMAQVCSVYGVQTAPAALLDTAPGADNGEPSPHGQDDAGLHCPLASLIANALLERAPAAVLAHAPAQAHPPLPALRPAEAEDASRRWLARQLHSPPVSA